MWPFKKKIKYLNNTILLKWRHEALGKLYFYGLCNGFYETIIDGITYRGERISGLRVITGDTGTFIQDALIDRAKIAKSIKSNKELEILKRNYKRFVRENGTVEQWNKISF